MECSKDAAAAQSKEQQPPIVALRELIQLTNLGIPLVHCTWPRVRLSSAQWLCVRHERKTGNELARQDSELSEFEIVQRSLHSEIPSYVTICSFQTDEVYTFEKLNVTSAQVNPSRSLVAISTCSVVSIYAIDTSSRVAWTRFPDTPEYWTWISEGIIAMISANKVWHWNIDEEDEMVFIFDRDARTNNFQVSSYIADTSLSWFALTSLGPDKNGDSVSGIAQIYSSDYQLSNCIEAHTVSFTRCRIPDTSRPILYLLVAKRATQTTGRLSIVELGAISSNECLAFRIEQISWLDIDFGRYDFPTKIICGPELGIIYVISKYGMLFVYDLETATHLHTVRLSFEVIFEAVLDEPSQGILAISRNGQILKVNLNLPALQEQLYISNSCKNLLVRLKQVLTNAAMASEEVTRL